MAKIDVIIPAYNEEDVIRDCLDSLLAQRHSDFIAWIIDDCSTDRTAEIIKGYAEQHPQRIRLLEFGKVGPGRARNLAAQQTEGEIIAFMDADCLATPSWLDELERGYTDETIASVGGPHISPKDANSFQLRLDRFLHSPWTRSTMDFVKDATSAEMRDTKHNPLCNVSYRRRVFSRLGGFREDLFPGEDYEMDERVAKEGHRMIYNPAALVFHHRPEDVQAWKKVMFAYGRAQGKLVRENGPRRHLHFIGLFVPLIVLVVLCALMFWESYPILLAFLLIGLLAFVAPRPNNIIGIYWASMDWFRGFIAGLMTNKSPPPASH